MNKLRMLASMLILVLSAFYLEAQCDVFITNSIVPTRIQIGDEISLLHSISSKKMVNLKNVSKPLLSESNTTNLFKIIKTTDKEITLKAVKQGSTVITITKSGEIQCETTDPLTPFEKFTASTHTPEIIISGLSAALCGDVNSDKQVNIIDALFIARYSTGIILSLTEPQGADVNDDGKINVVDSLLLAQHSVGYVIDLKCKAQEVLKTKFVQRASGIQCEEATFNNKEEAKANLTNNGIEVMNIWKTSKAVSAVCGVPTGTIYIAEINSKDEFKATFDLGWSFYHNK